MRVYAYDAKQGRVLEAEGWIRLSPREKALVDRVLKNGTIERALIELGNLPERQKTAVELANSSWILAEILAANGREDESFRRMLSSLTPDQHITQIRGEMFVICFDTERLIGSKQYRAHRVLPETMQSIIVVSNFFQRQNPTVRKALEEYREINGRGLRVEIRR